MQARLLGWIDAGLIGPVAEGLRNARLTAAIRTLKYDMAAILGGHATPPQQRLRDLAPELAPLLPGEESELQSRLNAGADALEHSLFGDGE